MSFDPDLFGHTPPQGDLFGAGQKDATPFQVKVDPDAVRAKLHAMLTDLRATQTGSPWPRETTRANQLIFPQMSNWLPPEERDQMVLDFAAEMQRLNLAA